MLSKTTARLKVLSSYFAIRRKCDSLADYYSLICTTSDGIFAPLQVEEEFLRFIAMVQSQKPQTLIEIGTAKGGTLFMLARAAVKDAHIVSIDLPYGRYGGGYSPIRIPIYKAFARDRQRVSLVRGDSHDPGNFDVAKRYFDGKGVDVLFIDGDHTYEGVRKDFELYSPLVKPGGMIALHDIVKNPTSHGCDVDLFWKELKASYQTTELIADRDQVGCGIGIVHVDGNCAQRREEAVVAGTDDKWSIAD